MALTNLSTGNRKPANQIINRQMSRTTMVKRELIEKLLEEQNGTAITQMPPAGKDIEWTGDDVAWSGNGVEWAGKEIEWDGNSVAEPAEEVARAAVDSEQSWWQKFLGKLSTALRS